jgi:integrase
MILENENISQEDQSIIQELLEENPDLKMTYKIKSPKFALKANQRRELLEIAKEQNYKHYLMILAQLELGLRVNELANLSIDSINFNEGLVTIQTRTATKYLKSFNTKTITSNRIIPIPKSLNSELRAYIGSRKTGYVFESNKLGPFLKNSIIGFINKYTDQSKSIICRRGVNGKKTMGSHVLRRTYASFLINNKIPIEKISKLLGHGSIRTTMMYLFDINDLDFDDVKKILNKMN